MASSHDRSDHRVPGPNWSRINQWLLWLGLAAAVFWMLYRHNAHLTSLLPFLFILACPLMHLFGHGGHGSRDRSVAGQVDRPRAGVDKGTQDSAGHQH